MDRRLGVLLEVKLLDFLPARHDAGPATERDPAPGLVEILVIDPAEIPRRAGERHQIVACTLVVVVRHRVRKATHDCPSQICSMVTTGIRGLRDITLLLFFAERTEQSR